MAFKGQQGNAREPHWDLVKRVITESDLVLEVLDARLVELSRNEEVERLIKEVGRPMIYVINKSDLVEHSRIIKQIEELKKSGEVVFMSTKQKGSSKILLYKIKKVFQKYGKRSLIIKGKFDPKPKFREAKANIVIGILGYPNVGKSSIINALAHKKKVKTSKKSGTTHGVHWINVSQDIKIIDTPGVIPLKKDDEIRYGLIGAKDTEALKNPEIVADAIIKLFLKQNPQRLFEFYKIESSEDVQEILIRLTQKKNYLLKGGKLNEERTMVDIVRDWQQGKLRL